MKEIFAIFIGFVMFVAVPVVSGWVVVSSLSHGAVFVWGRWRYPRDTNPFAFWTLIGVHAGVAAFMIYFAVTVVSDFIQGR